MLCILALWNKADITKTWSGTGYALYTGLASRFSVKRVSLFHNGITIRLDLYACHWLPFKRAMYALQKFVLWCQCGFRTPLFMISVVSDVRNPKYVYFDNIWHTAHRLAALEKTNHCSKWHYDKVFAYESEAQLAYEIERQYRIMKSASCVFCMGQWLKKHIDEAYPELAHKVIHVGGGFNTPVNQTNVVFRVNKKRRKLLFVGTDFYRKGGDWVVAAYKLLRAEGHDVGLTIAGPASKPEGVDESINYLGYVSYGEVQRLMATHDLFCMPSRFDAYGLVFAEALVNGLPCVARDAWEMPYFIEDGKSGRLVKGEDIRELAEAILEVLGNNSYYTYVESRREYYLKEYSWDKVCDKIAEHIK